MINAMANAKALVCPLLQNKLNYCVGLSTIVDAEDYESHLSSLVIHIIQEKG